MPVLLRKSRVPRRIYAFWGQGPEKAPDVVQLNLERWRSLNPDYELTILDKPAADALLTTTTIPAEVIASLPFAAYSDVLRAHLLRTGGGVWIDASIYPVRPLSQWLPKVTGPGFFGFRGPKLDRPIASWLLASTPGHPIITTWWDLVADYWDRPRTFPAHKHAVRDVDPVTRVAPEGRGDAAPYFWFHYLFAYGLRVDPAFAREWGKVREVWPGQCFRVWKAVRWNRWNNPQRLATLTAAAPVQKLALDIAEAYPVDVMRTPEFLTALERALTKEPLIPEKIRKDD